MNEERLDELLRQAEELREQIAAMKQRQRSTGFPFDQLETALDNALVRMEKAVEQAVDSLLESRPMLEFRNRLRNRVRRP